MDETLADASARIDGAKKTIETIRLENAKIFERWERLESLTAAIRLEGQELRAYEESVSGYPVPKGRADAEVRLHMDQLRDLFGSDPTAFAYAVSWFLHEMAKLQEPGDEVAVALNIATIALARLSGDKREGATVRRLARALQRSGAKVAVRMRIRSAVQHSTARATLSRVIDESERGPNGRAVTWTDEERRRSRAAVLVAELGAIDPRMTLPTAEAEMLVRLFGRANGTDKLAANWAWRAGVEAAKPGEDIRAEAPARVIELYRPAEKKRAKSAKRRSAKAG